MSVEMMMLQRFPQFPPKTIKALKKAADFRLLILDEKANSIYCTCCEKHFNPYGMSFRHGEKDNCPECGVLCEMVSNRYKWDPQTRRRERNFAVVVPAMKEHPEPEKRNCYITCVKVTAHYVQGMCEPVINITEHQRYIFTPDGRSLRYGQYIDWWHDDHRWYRELSGDWKVMSKFGEPVFDGKISECYEIYGLKQLKESCMKNSSAELMDLSGEYYNSTSLLQYLRFYNRHKGAERLIKAGFKKVVKAEMKSQSGYIDWKQMEPHRMLGLTRLEAKRVATGEINFRERRWLMKLMPEASPAQLDRYQNICDKYYYDQIEQAIRNTDANAKDVLKYLANKRQRGLAHEYVDYIRQCRELGYDIHNKHILFPPDLRAAHQRNTAAINALRSEQEAARLKELEKAYAKVRRNRKKLEFSSAELFVRQPKNSMEIIAEGEALDHCVGGYAERHISGELTILFLRKKSEPNTPYYTIEVSKDNKLIQCRGYANNWERRGGKPKEQEIIDFEELYKQHLDRISGRVKAESKKGA